MGAGLEGALAKTVCGFFQTELAPPMMSVGLPNPTPPVWSNLVTTCGAFLKRQITPKEILIEGVLLSSDFVVLYANPGVGKTLVGLTFAKALASGTPFGDRQVPSKHRVLYVDGELGGADLQGLIRKLDVPEGVHLVASIDLTESNAVADIADPDQQRALINLITAQKIEVVIFDNLFSLAQVREIVSNDDPGVVSLGRFGMTLRNLGITCIFVHHGTKSGVGPAGASRLTVNNDLTIQLTKEDAFIKLDFEKWRGRSKPEQITLKIVASDEKLNLVGCTPVSPEVLKWEREQKVLIALKSGPKSLRQIEEATGIAKTVVGDVVKALIAKGEAYRKGQSSPARITEQGKERLSKDAPWTQL